MSYIVLSMKIKQISMMTLLVFAISVVGSITVVDNAFAVSKSRWVSILCDSFQGPTAEGTVADECRRDAEDGKLSKRWYDKVINYDDWKNKTAAQLYEHIGKTPPSEDTDDSGDSNPIAGNGCGGVDTAVIKCDQNNSGSDIENNGIWGLLLIAINILTAGVGVLAVGGIVYAAILYTTAEDKADQIRKSTDIITNVVIGLVAFALMWAGLNLIIPGGVFS